MSATASGETGKERRTTRRLAALVADPAGLELAVRFVDRVARPEDQRVAARELGGLRGGDHRVARRGLRRDEDAEVQVVPVVHASSLPPGRPDQVAARSHRGV